MRQLALVHYWIGLFSSMRNTMPQTLAYSQHVLEEAQQLGDEELVALASVQRSSLATKNWWRWPQFSSAGNCFSRGAMTPSNVCFLLLSLYLNT